MRLPSMRRLRTATRGVALGGAAPVSDRNGATHARPQKISRPAYVASRGERDQAVDIGDRTIHAIDQRSLSRGPAVTAVIERVSGETLATAQSNKASPS